MSVSLEIHGDVALAIVDRPPVNAIDAKMRAGLLEALRAAESNPAVKTLVIACRGRTFMAGADLGELGSQIPSPGYRETFAAIEASLIPVIASLHGTALGGGLELALACHYRCATTGARLGMPEINLGILPGAGGTQRLPRLVGAAQALELLLQGSPVDATRAAELGLVDAIIGDDPIVGGLDYARRLLDAGAPPRPTRELATRLEPLEQSECAASLDRNARALKGRTTQNLIVAAIRAATEMTFDEGMDLEAELSTESLRSAESRALRHVFFAERECARIPGLDNRGIAQAVRRAAVVGAGTMGTGIAMALADAGIETMLLERDASALERGLNSIRESYAGSVRRGRLDGVTAESRRGRIRGTLAYEDLRDADLAIEAVFEDFDLKQSVLRRLDVELPQHAIIASNTSSLSLTALAWSTRRPERVLGLHFFSPANVMRLLEIVRGNQTSPETINAGLTLAKVLRKTGVVVGDGFGFVGNRMMLDGYFRESELMLLQGVNPARIDAVMEQFGFAMGPNKVNDMAGIDVGTRVRGELARREPRDPPYHVVSDALTGCGRFGQKTGRGVYRYSPGDRQAHEDPEFADFAASLAAQHGIRQRDVSAAEIEQRCLLSLVNIGANILAEGLAYRASDIDVIWTSGYGFPRWRGGPMHYADSLGLDQVVDRIRALADTGGGAYWKVSPLLADLARTGQTFGDRDRQRSQ
jgi:3-hydroxyacyl-CoA dehydrogenase